MSTGPLVPVVRRGLEGLAGPLNGRQTSESAEVAAAACALVCNIGMIEKFHHGRGRSCIETGARNWIFGARERQAARLRLDAMHEC